MKTTTKAVPPLVHRPVPGSVGRITAPSLTTLRPNTFGACRLALPVPLWATAKAGRRLQPTCPTTTRAVVVVSTRMIQALMIPCSVMRFMNRLWRLESMVVLPRLNRRRRRQRRVGLRVPRIVTMVDQVPMTSLLLKGTEGLLTMMHFLSMLEIWKWPMRAIMIYPTLTGMQLPRQNRAASQRTRPRRRRKRRLKLRKGMLAAGVNPTVRKLRRKRRKRARKNRQRRRRIQAVQQHHHPRRRRPSLRRREARLQRKKARLHRKVARRPNSVLGPSSYQLNLPSSRRRRTSCTEHV
mmetsp:Transcript_26560/g.58217  ORF Transcript_26560/g.58217 Transcript_26560/m.58217 type:complete len:295 (+) Transcript_26560:458-1342(+)